MKTLPATLLLLFTAIPGSLPAADLNITPEEKAEAAKISSYHGPVVKEIRKAYRQAQTALDAKDFDKLEKMAEEYRSSNAQFGDGKWKIIAFYNALPPKKKDPDGTWQNYEQILQEWIAAKPDSPTPRIAYAEFLTEYAWRARGSGYANTVSEEGWRLMKERLAKAKGLLDEAKQMKPADPAMYSTYLTVALGLSAPPAVFDQIVAASHQAAPKLWFTDTQRAYSLLPRWHGKPGDWERFAAETAARPDGPGAEVYTRIVMQQSRYHRNVFEETEISWDKTKEGIKLMLERYPESSMVLSKSTYLAVLAQDRAFAKELFAKLGDRYIPTVWPNKESFVHYRNWANGAE